MENKVCTQYNIEKYINNLYKKNSECKDCNIKRVVKRYFDNKEKVSIYDKKFEMIYMTSQITLP